MPDRRSLRSRAVDRTGNLSSPAALGEKSAPGTPELRGDVALNPDAGRRETPARRRHGSCRPARIDASWHLRHPARNGKWFWKGCKPNSVCPLARGENHLSGQPIPGIRLAFAKPGAGRSGIPYLALHPMGFSVPRRLRFARCALTAPFHPCRQLMRDAGGLIFCGTVRRNRHFQPSARVYPGRTSLGYAASRPLVFGLSSPGSRRERFSALPKPRANLAAKHLN